jgi:bifunctional non-homologous end joining protein LigD
MPTSGRVLVYAGRAGSGLGARELDALRARLERSRRKTPPFVGPPPAGRGHVWVEPELVCEVRYHQWTSDGLLRQPVFLRFRDDKLAEECERENGSPSVATPGPDRDAASAGATPAGDPAARVALSNPDKVFWPREGYTKRDLAEFYREIAPAMLPFLRDRPLVLTRFPDGIEGKSFFQKDAPEFAPEWIRTVRIRSEHAKREIDFFLADDADALAYLANLGTIPIHVWSSRVDAIDRPDWCVLDLDPKGAPFADVVRVARVIRALCESIELPSYPKTSGASGLHVLIPLGRRCDHEGARTLGELLARVVVAELPAIATIERVVRRREGKVYVDFLQNGHGKTIVAPFSVRPLPGAPVSTPLRWDEVDGRLDPARFTIRTVPGRVRKQRADPHAGVLADDVDLGGALERLARRVG